MFLDTYTSSWFGFCLLIPLLLKSFSVSYVSRHIYIQLVGIFSSEGALYVILPYDYPAQRSHFLNTHRSLTTTLNIDAMMTLVTMITMMNKMTKINKITRNVK